MLEGYVRDAHGVIHQLDPQPKVYDEQYLSYYEGLQERTIRLGFLRMGYLVGRLGHIPGSILELGYGTGSFIGAAARYGVARCAASDVEPFPLPDGVAYVAPGDWTAAAWDVVAAFDVLEHIPDLDFLARLRTRWLYLAVPHCRWNALREADGEPAADAWFRGWRMRLPDEHVHHFDPASLDAYLGARGYVRDHQIHLEDGLRLRPGEAGPNILTALYRR